MADQMMNQPLTDINQMEPDIINVDPKLPEDPNALFRGVSSDSEDDVYRRKLKEMDMNPEFGGAVEEEEQSWAVKNGIISNDADFMNIVTENLKAIPGGALDAIQETGNLAIDVADWAADNLAGKDINVQDFRIEALGKLIDKPDSLVEGGAVRGLTNFLLPFAGLSKITKGTKFVQALNNYGKTGKFVKGALLGAGVDFAAFDPKGERLSDLAQEVTGMSLPLASYLASEADDSAMEGRFKNAVEGIFLGATTEAAEMAFKGIKAMRKARHAEDVLKNADTAVKNTVSDIPEEVKLKQDAGNGPDEVKLDAEGKPISEVDKRVDEILEAEKPKAPEKTAAEIEAETMIRNALFEEETDAALEAISLKSINSIQDIDKLVKKYAGDVPLKEGNDFSRQVQTNEMTEKLAKDLGMTPDQLMARRKGQSYNAEELFAAQKILDETGGEVIALGKKASTGTDLDKAAYIMAVEKFKIVRQQMSGAAEEAGRALQILSKFKKSANKTNLQGSVAQLIQLHGGVSKVAKKAAQTGAMNMEQLNKTLKKGFGARFFDAALEVRAAGLLSGIPTQGRNILSNASVLAGNILERGVARRITVLRGGGIDGIQAGETSAMASGLVNGFKDSVALAKQAWKTGKSGFGEAATKLEGFDASLTSANFNVGADTLGGKFLDKIGNFIRLPFDALQASDDFFKQMNYSMDLHAQATSIAEKSKAVAKKTGKEFTPEIEAALYKKVLENPPDHIKIKSEKFAEVSTFTNELGPFGNNILKMRTHPVGRMLVPFVKTNINLMTYAIERTPLKLLQKDIIETLKRGGAEADMIAAKMATGTGFMAVSASLMAAGSITGKGPSNPKAKKMLEATGWRPFSVKVGDQYISYERLEPFGKLMKMGALAYESFATEDAEELDLLSNTMVASATFLGTAFNPEFLTENLYSLTETLENPLSNQAKHFVSSLGASFMPYSSMSRNIRKASDETQRVTFSDEQNVFLGTLKDTFLKIQNNIPGLSDSLTAKRNAFGEEVVYDSGIAASVVSPFSASEEKNDTVSKEIRNLGLDNLGESDLEEGEKFLVMGQIKRTLQVGDRTIKLNPKQYERLEMLSGGIELEGVDMTLREAWEEIIDDSFYESLERPDKIAMLMKKTSEYRRLAKQQFLFENEDISNNLLGRDF